MEFKGRSDIIKSVQAALNLTADGIDGAVTWKAIATKLGIAPAVAPAVASTVTTISDAVYALIIKYEVGGGESYYNAALKHPEYPGGASGVTIGIGYDLGYTTLAQFASDWKSLLSSDIFNVLSLHLGKTGDAAKAIIHTLNNIVIPWSAAEAVFKTCDIPRYSKETIAAFPGSDKLKPDVFGALVSVTFNRGGSMSGDSRLEMRNIRDAISGNIKTENIYEYIASQIVKMKRLWIGKNLNGLERRRDEEAALVKACA